MLIRMECITSTVELDLKRQCESQAYVIIMMHTYILKEL